MKRLDRKSDCAINFTLESIGDPWSLLIIRDIVYYGKKTFGEFLDADERIATGVLSRRLADLECRGILVKHKASEDRRKELYHLTKKGLDLIPLLLDCADWGARYDAQTQASRKWIDAVRADKEGMLVRIQECVRQGRSVFMGKNCLVNEL